LAVLASGCGTPAGNGSSPPPGPAGQSPPGSLSGAVPGCPSSGVEMGTEVPSAAMGLRVMTVTMANCGDGPVTVSGYPSLRALDDERKQIDVRVIEGRSSIHTDATFEAEPRPVTLKPGERARAAVAWRNTVTASDRAADVGHYLEVAPAAGDPGQLTTPDGTMDLGTTGRISVSPWHRPATNP
ncbi:DUF4232 domain-containing protein, partial [Streptomyces sparsus]